jgi:hypothetical protein
MLSPQMCWRFRAPSIAGVKDKHATTAQEVTLAAAGPAAAAALRAFAAARRLPGLRVSAIRPCAAPLAPGRHAGNQFRILIRNVTRPEAAAAAGRRLRRRGFVNYFGLQRFGTGSAPALEVGSRLGHGVQQRIDNTPIIMMIYSYNHIHNDNSIITSITMIYNYTVSWSRLGNRDGDGVMGFEFCWERGAWSRR